MLIRLQDKDSALLEWFIRDIGGNKEQIKHNKVKKSYVSKKEFYYQADLVLNSKDMINDLLDLNMPMLKKECDPSLIKIAMKLRPAFMRGIWDGDGCLYSKWVKNGMGEYKAFRVKFSLAGSKKTCSEFSCHMGYWGKNIRHLSNKTWTFDTSIVKSISKIYNKLYCDNGPFLARKRNKFHVAMHHLSIPLPINCIEAAI